MREHSPGQTTVSICLPISLLKEIDRRAESLGLPRSTYLTVLARQDLRELGNLILSGDAVRPSVQVELSDEARDFLIAAVPALLEYERQVLAGTEPTPFPAPATPLTSSDLWQRFEQERQSILENKWYRSKDAGHDIGMERAIRDWLQNHASPAAATPPP